jgi:hypothetical protein
MMALVVTLPLPLCDRRSEWSCSIAGADRQRQRLPRQSIFLSNVERLKMFRVGRQEVWVARSRRPALDWIGGFPL